MLTDLQPLIRSTQIVSEDVKVTDMSKSEYMQARPSYVASILWRARRRELEMKHHLKSSAATVMGTGMQAQAQAPKPIMAATFATSYLDLIVASNMSKENGVLAVPVL